MDVSIPTVYFVLLLYCSFIHVDTYNSYVSAQNRTIVPVIDKEIDISDNCEHTLRTIQNQVTQNGKSEKVRDIPLGDSSHLNNKTAFDPQPYGADEDERIVSAYIPQCRPDRPDLYVARQCNEYDCFCVNVTTGVTLLGTRASPSEVGDCSTAVYSVLLALRRRSILPTPAGGESHQGSSSKTDDVLLDFDTSLKLRIQNSIEKILHSAVGFQRVTSVTRIFVTPDTQNSHNSSEFVYYQVELTSTGHSSLKAPQDLLENRLHEGFLSDVGAVDPRTSYVKIIESKIPDPAPLTSSNEVFPHESVDLLSDKQTNLYSNKSEHSQQQQQSKSIPVGHKMVAVRSSEMNEDSYIGSRDASSILKPLNLKSSENAEHMLDPFKPITVNGGASAVRQTSIHSRSLHQSWTSGTSTSKILSQPGVIAGIVGSVVVVLLLLILLILFCIYRLRKKDEGSYALDEPKKLPTVDTYTRPPTREFYA
ncbi:Syndecan isoform 1 [Schistosoma japonicum]|uniref:Syndecan isoform 1 n=1 Tax=Schistosoma japonicum TaxID=6182 RepID=A0A4Z2DFB3_SCHJA|nr:Syndecan isoform 1 [Schistosoma japonicum]